MDIELNKKQNRRVTIFAIILSIVSIGLLVFGFFIVSSDKVVMLQSISNLSTKFDSLLDNNSSLFNKLATSDDVGIKYNLKANYNTNNLDLSIDYLENKKDEKSKLLFDLKVNENPFLGLDLALDNNKTYISVDDITSNYYYFDNKYVSLLTSLSSNDYDKSITLLKEAIIDYIDNGDIKREKVSVLYNGKNKKVNKLTYEITNKDIKNVVSNYVSSLKKDKTLLKKLAIKNNLSQKEMINKLNGLVESFNYEKVESLYNYSVYYYGFNKIVQYELDDIINNSMIQYKVENKESINLFDDSMNIFSIEIVKNKNKYDFNGSIFIDKLEYSFSGNILDDKTTILFNYDNNDYKLLITSKEEEQENSFSYNTKIEFYKVKDIDSMIGYIDFSNKYYFNEKVSVDLTNSVNITEITEEDISSIKNNFFEHPIYELFNSIKDIYNISL